MRREIQKYSLISSLLIVLLSINSVNASDVQTVNNVKASVPAPIIETQTQDSAKSIDKLVCNHNHRIKIIFSDIDATLIPLKKNPTPGEVPESVKSAYQKLKNAGIPLILVTGRSSSEEKLIAANMKNDRTYRIAQQGAEIVAPNGKIIYEDTIKHSDGVKMFKDIEKFKKANKIDSKIFLYLHGKLYATETYTIPYLWDKIIVLKSFNELNSIQPEFSFTKIGIYDENIDNLVRIQTYLKTKYPNYRIDISSRCFCDITSATANKGNGVKKLAKMLNVDLANAAAFGDAENDISMLNLVKTSGGLAVAVGNAMPATKEAASYITDTAEQDGFSKAVDKILINNALFK